MPRVLDITGEYPPDWQEISDRVWAEAGHRCIRCFHPYRKGEHGKGEWSPCDGLCQHGGPLAYLFWDGILGKEFPADNASEVIKTASTLGSHAIVVARWRVATVHHLDGNKANCVWWNLLALCQRCHLKTQARVNPHQPYMLEHEEWFKPYAAGFYAFKYECRQIDRSTAVAEMERLLAWERKV